MVASLQSWLRRKSLWPPRLRQQVTRTGLDYTATLLLVAESDRLVDPSGSREFARRAAAGGQLTTRFFSMLYHELFHEAEPWRAQVFLQLGDWLDRVAAPALDRGPGV